MDYSRSGLYFITICTKGKECLFGDVVDNYMILNDLGKIAEEEWKKSAEIREEIELDEFIIMPNHIHSIVVINQDCRDARRCVSRYVSPDDKSEDQGILNRKPKSLSSFVAGYKSSVTKRINMKRETLGHPIWQSRFHDRIIRNEKELSKIRKYIKNNPGNWDDDPEK